MKQGEEMHFPALIEGYRSALLFFKKGVIYFDQQGFVLHANEAAHQLLGYVENSLPGKSIIDVNPHLSLMGWRKLWESLLENNSYSERTEFLHAEGNLLAVNSLLALAREQSSTHAMLFFESLPPGK